MAGAKANGNNASFFKRKNPLGVGNVHTGIAFSKIFARRFRSISSVFLEVSYAVLDRV